MSVKPAFDVLSDVIEQYELRGTVVRRVDATTTEREGGTELRAEIDLPVAGCETSNEGLHSNLCPRNATLTEDGGLQVEFSSPDPPDLPSTSSASVSARAEDVRVADGTVLLTVELTIDGATRADGGDEAPAAVDSSATDRASDTAPDGPTVAADQPDADAGDGTDADDTSEFDAVRNEDVPPYDDTEYLQRLYDSSDTFVEMSRKIEMDVAAETVRRYMIAAGVHDPKSYDTTSEDEQVDESTSATEGEDAASRGSTSDRSPTATDDAIESISDGQLVTDGFGLPKDLRITDVADAVVDSGTVHEVQRHLDLERQRTQELLKQFDLLDLVSCRIADSEAREVSYEEVAARISRCTPSGA